jgi:GT2 family glycosyltransferase
MASLKTKDFGVVLVDNSCSLVESELSGFVPNLRLVVPDKNIGFAAANNLGISLCESDFVALLNPDAFPEPGWLENLLLAAQGHEDCAAFGSVQLSDKDPERIDGLGDHYHPSGVFWRKGHARKLQENPEFRERGIFSACAAAALFRREALLSAGGFDEDFFCYGEDVDLGFRLRLAGWKAILVPGAVVRHLGSAASGGARGDFATYHGHRNMVWVYVKNMPGILFWMFLPLHIAANLAGVAVLAWRGQGSTAVRAKIDAIRGIPGMWRKRKQIQGTRSASNLRILNILLSC